MPSQSAWFNKVSSYRCLQNSKGHEADVWQQSQNRLEVEGHHQIFKNFIFFMINIHVYIRRVENILRRKKIFAHLPTQREPLLILWCSVFQSLPHAILFYAYHHNMWTKSPLCFSHKNDDISSFLYYYSLFEYVTSMASILERINCNLLNHFPAIGQVDCLQFLLLLSIILWRISWHIRDFSVLQIISLGWRLKGIREFKGFDAILPNGFLKGYLHAVSAVSVSRKPYKLQAFSLETKSLWMHWPQRTKAKAQHSLQYSEAGEELTCVSQTRFWVTTSWRVAFIQFFDGWGRDLRLLSNILKIIALCHILKEYFVCCLPFNLHF